MARSGSLNPANAIAISLVVVAALSIVRPARGQSPEPTAPYPLSPPPDPLAISEVRVAEESVAQVIGLTKSPPTEPPSFVLVIDATARFIQFNGSTGQPGAGHDGAVYGARQRLAFDVAPVIAAGARANLTFPDRKGWERYGLRAGYEWVASYSSGGSISESSDLASALGASGAPGQILRAAGAAIGLGFSAEYTRFTAGRAQVQVADTGAPVSAAPLEFTRTRLEASFDLGPHLLPVKDVLVPIEQRSTIKILGDYYSVALPRIVYVTAQANDPTNGTRTFVVAESTPQTIRASIYALGGSARWVPLASRTIGHVAGELTALVGAGHAGFNLPAQLGVPQSATNQVRLATTGPAFIGRASIDGAIHLGLTEAVDLAFGVQVGTEVYYVRGDIGGTSGGIVGFQDFFSFGQCFLSGQFRRQ